jgi:flagellar biosynthesis/type III secretory pathway ATPase
VAATVSLAAYRERVAGAQVLKRQGHVAKVVGLTIEVVGMEGFIGEVCDITSPGKSSRCWRRWSDSATGCPF